MEIGRLVSTESKGTSTDSVEGLAIGEEESTKIVGKAKEDEVGVEEEIVI